MAWSAAYFVAAVAGLGTLTRRIGPAALGVGRTFVQSSVAAVALAIVAVPLAAAIGHESAGRAAVAATAAGLVGATCYLAVLALLHSAELAALTDMLRRRSRASAADVSP